METAATMDVCLGAKIRGWSGPSTSVGGGLLSAGAARSPRRLYSRAMQRLVTSWVWTVWVLAVLFGFPIVCVLFALTAPVDPGRYVVGRFFRLIGVVGAKANPWWHFRTTGYRPENPRNPYVAVSNHESYADIFLNSNLPWEMK